MWAARPLGSAAFRVSWLAHAAESFGYAAKHCAALHLPCEVGGEDESHPELKSGAVQGRSGSPFLIRLLGNRGQYELLDRLTNLRDVSPWVRCCFPCCWQTVTKLCRRREVLIDTSQLIKCLGLTCARV